RPHRAQDAARSARQSRDRALEAQRSGCPARGPAQRPAAAERGRLAADAVGRGGLDRGRSRVRQDEPVPATRGGGRRRLCCLREGAMRELTYAEAAIEAIAEEMRRDARIFYLSTD